MTGKDLIRIAVASTDDLEAIRAIALETYRDHFSSIWSAQGLQEFLNREFADDVLASSLASTSHLWLIARDQRDVGIGYAKINWRRSEPITQAVGAELQKIYFRASATGKGHGAKLLGFVVTESLQRGQAIVWLDVLKSNHAAQRFYRKLGFEPIGETSFNTDIREIGMVVMVRRLTVA